jgi:hypothetical protein
VNVVCKFFSFSEAILVTEHGNIGFWNIEAAIFLDNRLTDGDEVVSFTPLSHLPQKVYDVSVSDVRKWRLAQSIGPN